MLLGAALLARLRVACHRASCDFLCEHASLLLWVARRGNTLFGPMRKCSAARKPRLAWFGAVSRLRLAWTPLVDSTSHVLLGKIRIGITCTKRAAEGERISESESKNSGKVELITQ